MSDDLVKRLRAKPNIHSSIYHEAADEIEQLCEVNVQWAQTSKNLLERAEAAEAELEVQRERAQTAEAAMTRYAAESGIWEGRAKAAEAHEAKLRNALEGLMPYMPETDSRTMPDEWVAAAQALQDKSNG